MLLRGGMGGFLGSSWGFLVVFRESWVLVVWVWLWLMVLMLCEERKGKNKKGGREGEFRMLIWNMFCDCYLVVMDELF